MTKHIILALCIVLTACSSGNVSLTSEPSGEKALTAYAFLNPVAAGVIDESARTISVTVPHGTDITALVANFTTTGAIVRVGSAVQVSGSSVNDFTNHVTYDVVAANGSSTTYTVIVSLAHDTAKAITAFSFADPAEMAIIDEVAKTVMVTVPYGTDLTGLTATFTSSGVSVDVGGIPQQSGVTPNDFTHPIVYTVTADDNSTAAYTVNVSIANYVHLESDPGDYIGAGKSYTYTQADAQIVMNATGVLLFISIKGNQNWSGNFQVPNSLNQLQPGSFTKLTRYPFNDPAIGGLDWDGEGRGCNTLTGWFVIDNVVYTNGSLSAVDLRFEQHCEGATAALHGQIHWTPNDTTVPPGPINPPPAGLWQPVSGVTPTTGNYIYLQSDAGDYIGAGKAYTYTQADAQIGVTATGGLYTINITGNQNWTGNFKAMNTLSQLQTGYYGTLQRYPFNNPVLGGLSWYGEGRGCNTLTGWFVIDNVTYANGTLSAIDLRFEQHCEGGSSALHGQIHWTPNDPTVPPGPVNPPPAGLWQPVSGVTPTTGNYVYLQSDAGDYIGAGQTYTYTPADAQINVSATGGLCTISVTGNQNWTGNFKAMNNLSQLQPGYYGILKRYPFHNPILGGLSWTGQGRGCNNLTGWFVVDDVTYTNGTISAIDLRFEQHCEGLSPALHGQIHWIQ